MDENGELVLHFDVVDDGGAFDARHATHEREPIEGEVIKEAVQRVEKVYITDAVLLPEGDGSAQGWDKPYFPTIEGEVIEKPRYSHTLLKYGTLPIMDGVDPDYSQSAIEGEVVKEPDAPDDALVITKADIGVAPRIKGHNPLNNRTRHGLICPVCQKKMTARQVEYKPNGIYFVAGCDDSHIAQVYLSRYVIESAKSPNDIADYAQDRVNMALERLMPSPRIPDTLAGVAGKMMKDAMQAHKELEEARPDTLELLERFDARP